MTDILERLNRLNDIEIIDVNDPRFESYGRIVRGFDFEPLMQYMRTNTEIPSAGNVYTASVREMEEGPLYTEITSVLYGGRDIQIGCCNGVNSTYNGFEYHKGSEINIAVTGFMLVLAHVWQVRDNTIRTEDAQVFYVPEGTAIEMYQTTLHLSPCKITDEGFRDIVILPRGTNTPLSDAEKALRDRSQDPESRLLLQRNKWVLAHPERRPLIEQGAHPGLIGENKELKYREAE